LLYLLTLKFDLSLQLTVLIGFELQDALLFKQLVVIVVEHTPQKNFLIPAKHDIDFDSVEFSPKLGFGWLGGRYRLRLFAEGDLTEMFVKVSELD
jgi:hypothetical protein